MLCGLGRTTAGGIVCGVGRPWSVRSADRKFFRYLAGQFVRPRRLAGLVHWRRHFRMRTAGRIFWWRLGRTTRCCRRYFRRFDRHYITTLRLASPRFGYVKHLFHQIPDAVDVMHVVVDHASLTLQPHLISVGRWDRPQGFPAAGSPACCRYRVSVRGFPDQRPREGTVRHRTAPACRQVVQIAGRLSCLRAQSCPSAVRAGLARN